MTRHSPPAGTTPDADNHRRHQPSDAHHESGHSRKRRRDKGARLHLSQKTSSSPTDRTSTRYDKLSTLQKYLYQPLWELNAKVQRCNVVLRSADFDGRAPRNWLTGNANSRQLARSWQSELDGGENKKETRRKSPSLMRAIWRTHGWSFLNALACMGLTDLICEPAYFYLCVKLIEIIGNFKPESEEQVDATTNDNDNNNHHHDANPSQAAQSPAGGPSRASHRGSTSDELYSHALVFLAAIVTYQLMTHAYAWLNHKMGLKLRVALSEMVYRKSLTIDRFSSTSSSASSSASASASCLNHEQALNLISRDLESLEARFAELSWVVTGPFQCVILTAIVSRQLDFWTAIVACLLTTTAAMQRAYINLRLRKYSRLAAAVADKRMDLIGEAVEAIRLVRMYAWTRPIEARIGENRELEISHRRRHLRARAIDVALFFITSSAASLLALIFAHYLRGFPVTQSMVSQLFLVTAAYRRALSRNLAQGMQAWAQVLVVVERCEKYLMARDRPESLAEISPGKIERSGGGGSGGGGWICDKQENGTQTSGNAASDDSSWLTNDPAQHEAASSSQCVCSLENVSIAWPSSSGNSRDPQKSASINYCLRQVNMIARQRELIMVAGQIGSGKSSLLQVLLSELAPHEGVAWLKRGTRVAYAPQKAWVFSGTVRENVVMGLAFNLDRYYEVLRVCALLPDLDNFPDYDRTRVGERGVTLSGGQRARINLARALYQRADIYLLDDPLSAVDGHVLNHIFIEALRGFLRDKTVVLVTHQVQYLNQVDKILYLGSQAGGVAARNFFGTYDELERSNLLGELLLVCSQNSTNDKTKGEQRHHQATHLMSFTEKTRVVGDRNRAIDRILSNRLDKSASDSIVDCYQDEMHEISESRRKNKGHVLTSKVARAASFYLENAGTGWQMSWFAIVNILMRSFFISLNIFLNFWAGFQVWQESTVEGGGGDATTTTTTITGVLIGNKLELDADIDSGPHQANEANWLTRQIASLSMGGVLLVTGFIWLIVVALSSIRIVQFYTLATRASRLIHSKLVHSILWTKLSFFDHTAQGHLINRLAADVSYLDTQLIGQIDQISVTGISTGFVFLGIVSSQFKLALVVCLMALAVYWLFRYLADLMELFKYLDGFRRANLYSHVGATLDGLPAIRSSNQEEAFIQKFNHLLDQHSSVRFLMISVKRFIIGVVDWILVVFYVSLVVFTVYDTLQGNGLLAFVGLNLMVQLTRIAQNTLIVFVEFYLSVQSMDRIRECATELEEEKAQLFAPYAHSTFKSPIRAKSHTDSGKSNKEELAEDEALGLEEARFNTSEGCTIQFSGVSLKFMRTNKLVLENVSFVIEPGTKVGIIGRTGAGKSSLITALFHLYHFEGFIYLNGQDTKQLKLESLRKCISIIPQEPSLFTGSIRYNLDPFGEYSDESLWRALEVVQLKQLIQASLHGLEMPVTKSGSNFSIGQRQLICLARAILKENAILVMDEATSSIDQETDTLVQQAIRSEFKRCTVLTIAHRLSTVIELDKLMIMQDGRVVEFGRPRELLERGSRGLLCRMIDSTGEQQAAVLRAKIVDSSKKEV